MRRATLALGLAAALTAGQRAGAQEAPNPAAPPKITLNDAIQRALARNPSAAVAAEEVRRAQALVREARAASLPTLTGNAVYTRLDHDRVLGSGPTARLVAAANQESANLQLVVPLVVPNRWLSWSHASDAIDTARASAQDVRRQVAVNTARAYLTVVSQRRIVDVYQRATATAKAHAEFAKAQFEGGVGNRIDHVRAEQLLAASDNQVQLSLVAVTKAQEALGVLIGDPGPADAAEDVALPSSAANLNEALDEAGSRRPDVQAARVRVRNADRFVKDSWADYMPQLLGTFQPFYQHPATLTSPQWGWQAQLLLSVPFYDGGLRYGLHDERRALANEAHTQLDASLRQARSDVRSSYEAVRRAEQALASARKAAKLASEALELATMAYKAGASTNIEVIDAERQARDAETSAVIAEDTARQARLDLLAASGRFP
jgi:outer membrane protein